MRPYLPLLALSAFATACDVPTSDATANLQAQGQRDGEIWLAPGATTAVLLDSDDPELIDWELATIDPEIAGIAGLRRVAEATNQVRSLLTAGQHGDTSLMIHDEEGALVQEVLVHVVNPDRLALVGLHGRGGYVPGSTVRILRGELVDFWVAYAFEDISLPSPSMVAIADDPDERATIAEGGERVQIAAPAGSSSASVVLTAGPDARLDVQVVAVDAADVTATLTSEEDGADAGDRVMLMPLLTDPAGDPVFVSSYGWTVDGVRTVGWDGVYTYDPTAPPTQVALIVGRDASTVTVTVTIHRAP